jgi:hypothetical protein
MYIAVRDQLAAQRLADLHRQAAKQRLLRQLRASRKRTIQRRRTWERLTLRRPQPAVMTRTRAADGAGVARGSLPAARRAG